MDRLINKQYTYRNLYMRRTRDRQTELLSDNLFYFKMSLFTQSKHWYCFTLLSKTLPAHIQRFACWWSPLSFKKCQTMHVCWQRPSLEPADSFIYFENAVAKTRMQGTLFEKRKISTGIEKEHKEKNKNKNLSINFKFRSFFVKVDTRWVSN